MAIVALLLIQEYLAKVCALRLEVLSVPLEACPRTVRVG